LDDEPFAPTISRSKHRCYKCGQQYEASDTFASVGLTIERPTVEHIAYHLCVDCTEGANTLLEKWCGEEVPA